MKNSFTDTEKTMPACIEYGFAALLDCMPNGDSFIPEFTMGFAGQWGSIVKRTPKPKTPEKKDDPITFDMIRTYNPELVVSFHTNQLPYSEVCSKYDITIFGAELERKTGFKDENTGNTIPGFDGKNYNHMRNDNRPVKLGAMMAACLLSKVSVQQLYDAFDACRDVENLLLYGYAGAVLAYLVTDYDEHDKAHTYDEFLWYTLNAYKLAGIDDIPEIFPNNRRWKDMKDGIDAGTFSYDDVVTIE